ncbi:flagellar biosynthetic protein FliO [Vibrio sp. PP-XX7]
MKRLIGLSVFPLPALAASDGPTDILTTLGALVFVVLFILLLAFLAKRMRLPGLAGGYQKDLSVLRQLPVGAKERLLIVKAGEEQFLVGVTSQSIQLISKLDKPIEEPSQMVAENPFATQAEPGC